MFPGNPSHWFWGHVNQYPGPNEAGLKFQRELTGKFPRVARAWLGPFVSFLIVSHPETLKLILKTSEPKSRTYALVEPWLGDGLLLSRGSKWSRNRRLLTPAFHFEILKPYMKINNRAADIFIEKLGRFYKKGEYFEVFTEISMYTLDVILRCAFSYETDCQKEGKSHPYVVAVNKLSDLAVDRFLKFWLHNKFIYSLTSNGRQYKKNCDYVHQVAEDVIAKRKQALAGQSVEELQSKKKCVDFLDILLTARDENNEGLTDIEIRNEVDTFLFEGHDTTASALAWTLYSLAMHPEIQTEVQKEIDSIMYGRDSDDVLWEDLSEFHYLTMCTKEAMRLHTPVPFIQRQTTQNLDIDGKSVPVGTTITILIYNVHHNPFLWEDSMEYRPERFSPENIDKQDPYAFIPFSAGPRNCIGQNFAMHEIKTILVRTLRRFTLVLDKNHDVQKKEGVVMRSENGIKMMAIPRIPQSVQ
ncbi:hypothetical protein ScPMuIL_007063 [Solemya velum]